MLQNPEPRTASTRIRERIVECLRTPGCRFIHENPSRNYLDCWGITDIGLYEELAEDLEKYELFLKPKQSPHKGQKYQYVLRSLDEEDKAILIHVTLSHNEEPPLVNFQSIHMIRVIHHSLAYCKERKP